MTSTPDQDSPMVAASPSAHGIAPPYELTLVAVGVLRAAGLRLDPTGRNPNHFTVSFDDRLWPNPYHEE